MTKNEMIAEMQHDCVNQQGEYQDGVRYGALRMYDHRQKEIDELREQVRWWIERWTCFWSVPKCKADFDRIAEAEKELNAAASRVLVK